MLKLAAGTECLSVWCQRLSRLAPSLAKTLLQYTRVTSLARNNNKTRSGMCMTSKIRVSKTFDAQDQLIYENISQHLLHRSSRQAWPSTPQCSNPHLHWTLNDKYVYFSALKWGENPKIHGINAGQGISAAEGQRFLFVALVVIDARPLHRDASIPRKKMLCTHGVIHHMQTEVFAYYMHPQTSASQMMRK